jgi:hypothetical protein
MQWHLTTRRPMNYRPALPSERAPHNEYNRSGQTLDMQKYHQSHMGLGVKTAWLTDRPTDWPTISCKVPGTNAYIQWKFTFMTGRITLDVFDKPLHNQINIIQMFKTNWRANLETEMKKSKKLRYCIAMDSEIPVPEGTAGNSRLRWSRNSRRIRFWNIQKSKYNHLHK